jgi:hypothetical protein
LYLGAIITGMGIFIGCRYESHMGIDAATLPTVQPIPSGRSSSSA